MKSIVRKCVLNLITMMTLTSCSFSLSSRSIATGCSVLSDYIEYVYNTDSLAKDGASVIISIKEEVSGSKKKDKQVVASYSSTSLYSAVDGGYRVDYLCNHGSGDEQFSVTCLNGIFTYSDGTSSKASDSSDPMFVFNSFDDYLRNYICNAFGKLFNGYFTSVYNSDLAPEKAAILTGCNVKSTNNILWDFNIYSDYLENEKDTLGINDSEYRNLFLYSNIDSKPAHTLGISINNGKLTRISAYYSYESDDYDGMVEGTISVGVSYGG